MNLHDQKPVLVCVFLEKWMDFEEEMTVYVYW